MGVISLRMIPLNAALGSLLGAISYELAKGIMFKSRRYVADPNLLVRVAAAKRPKRPAQTPA